MAGYKLATYQSMQGPRAGIVVDETVFDAAELTAEHAYASVLGMLEAWQKADGAVRAALEKREFSISPES